MENKEEVVYLYAGIINTISSVLYWKIEDNTIVPKIGDYAVVENANGYNLIKVVGITITTKENVTKFSKTKYENMKRIIKVVMPKELEKNKNMIGEENNV